jgi:hypothetical protein
MYQINREELAWADGLFEGEGSFGYSPKMQLGSTEWRQKEVIDDHA